MKIVPWIIGLLVYLVIPFTSVAAAGEFTAAYDVQYAIAPSGVAIVTQNITLTNQLSNLYPQKYSILIDSLGISNIIAYDNLGIIRPEIRQEDGKTEIALIFNEKIAGLGKQLRFSLRYESTDIAVKNGAIWEVNIPGVADELDLSSYFVTLSVPSSFGANAYMSPLPAAGGKWTKEQMTKGGISAAYGQTQAFDLTLSYHVDNPTVTSRLTELALPPDTAFQKVFVRTLTPAPKTVLEDSDGNWLAQYELLPTQRLEVKATITVAISLFPRQGYSEPLLDRDQYIRPDKYWESNDSDIRELARIYTTPREIYDYVVDTLAYDYKRASQIPIRKGAIQALKTPDNSICMEYTDLFIAIARAAGIPAREAVGYAHTTNARLRPLSLVSDVLHAWPEYYDLERLIWVPVDPTWADTTGGVNYFDKLDFNHIVFSYYGKSSVYPFPAGFYKNAGQNTKDVLVRFAKSVPGDTLRKLAVTYNFPDTVTSGFAAAGQVLVENRGETSAPGASVNIQSAPTDVAITERLDDIPPYAKVAIPISMDIPGYFYQGRGSIVTTLDGEVSTFDFTVVPLAYQFLLPIAAGLAIVIILVFAWIRSGIWKHRKKP